MATIEPYSLSSGARRYMVRYLQPNRKATKKRGFTSKRAAQEWLAANTVAMNTGEWRPDSAGRITVADATQAWLDAKTPSVAPKTAASYADSVRHIKDVGQLGGVRLKHVTHERVEEWVAAMRSHEFRPGEKLSAKTVRNSFGVLSQVMKRAVRDNRIPSNPCDGVDLPRVEKQEQVILTPAELETMAAAAGEFYGDHVRALGMSGLRFGELAGLQVQDVNLDTLRMHIRRQITDTDGRLIHSEPKYGKRRTVPIIAPLATILRTHCEGKEASDLVFTTQRGTPLRNQNARRDWFNPAASAAGYPDLTPHDLRHTFASVAISAGASIKALQHALGHHSAGFTLDQYGHLFPDDLDSFNTSMGRLFTAGCAQNVPTAPKNE